MRSLLFLTRRLHRAHRVVFLPHKLKTTPKLNHYAHLKPFYQIHFIAAFDQTPSRQYHANSISQHEHLPNLIKFPDFDEYMNQNTENNQNDQLGIDKFVQNIQKAKDFASGDEAISFLDDLGIKPNKDFILSAVWALREEWKLAFLVVKWGKKWGCSTEKAWHMMVWLLGNHQKFCTAWSVISDIHSAKMDTEQAILILIDRYAAANCPEKAIETFQTMDMFRLSPDQRRLHTLLNILCNHGIIEEAEKYMHLNRKLFPLDAPSFNIILNGWCNVTVDVYAAKRVWREMARCCVLPDGVSYMYMISCFSKIGNLFDSLRLYDLMQKHGWTPGVEVYNSLIYVLTREDCLKEALKLVNKMKETGLQPNCSSFNSMILPLCEAMKSEEAKIVLALMIEETAGPTIDTYHAFLINANLETTLEVLTNMKKASLGPTSDTFLIVLDNFFKLKQPGNALKIWEEMDRYYIIPQRAHYNAMLEILEKDLLIEARRFYMEMISKGMIVDPKFHKLVAKPVEEDPHKNEGREVSYRRHIDRGNQRHYGKNNWHQSQWHMNNSSWERTGAR